MLDGEHSLDLIQLFDETKRKFESVLHAIPKQFLHVHVYQVKSILPECTANLWECNAVFHFISQINSTQ